MTWNVRRVLWAVRVRSHWGKNQKNAAAFSVISMENMAPVSTLREKAAAEKAARRSAFSSHFWRWAKNFRQTTWWHHVTIVGTSCRTERARETQFFRIPTWNYEIRVQTQADYQQKTLKAIDCVTMRQTAPLPLQRKTPIFCLSVIGA